MQPKYVTKDEFLKENRFSDSQLETLMENMTIFMPMDGCPSPCNICAYKAKKTVDFAMDVGLIEWFYTNFTDCFNTNQPSEHGNDQLAYRGRDGETFVDILELHKQYLTYYPRVLSGFPHRAGEVLQQILEMQFVSEKHPSDDENAQLVVPGISRHPANQRVVDNFLRGIEKSEGFVLKERTEGETTMARGHKLEDTYQIKTTKGIREFRVLDIDIATVGNAERFVDENTGSRVYVAERPGIAVLPMGFYNYSASRAYYPDMIKHPITPESFSLQKMSDESRPVILFYDKESGEINKLDIGVEGL